MSAVAFPQALTLHRRRSFLLDRDDAIELAWKRYWRGLEAIDCGR
jgi:hypothetical protein